MSLSTAKEMLERAIAIRDCRTINDVLYKINGEVKDIIPELSQLLVLDFYDVDHEHIVTLLERAMDDVSVDALGLRMLTVSRSSEDWNSPPGEEIVHCLNLMAADVLGKIGNEQSRAYLVKGLDCDFPEVRQRCRVLLEKK